MVVSRSLDWLKELIADGSANRTLVVDKRIPCRPPDLLADTGELFAQVELTRGLSEEDLILVGFVRNYVRFAKGLLVAVINLINLVH
ncbi:hypothetical protein AVEN_4827-1 [Araneus ventricosus]|uniref:Uncharacterized protein n=1 Tax=Araneus ventricosus TaxID=182803 RepID=A0A4Y2GD69_ARAVE|nr:hypothetical protein AVEN_4827-1 [Araneus ventricosus]